MVATASAAGIPAVSMIMCGSSHVDHGEVSIAGRQVVTVPSGIIARKAHEPDLTKVMVNFLRTNRARFGRRIRRVGTP
jgi:hypothetical protein